MSKAFHVSSQRDSKIASQIAATSLVDSATMKSISILGMIFLPGTLISVCSHYNIPDLTST